jgi:hypothetical protein
MGETGKGRMGEWEKRRMGEEGKRGKAEWGSGRSPIPPFPHSPVFIKR